MRFGNVTGTVLETWIRRDYGLTGAELKTVIELRNESCPAPGVGGLGLTTRTIYLSQVIVLLPSLAKPRCAKRAGTYTAQVVEYLWPKPKS